MSDSSPPSHGPSPAAPDSPWTPAGAGERSSAAGAVEAADGTGPTPGARRITDLTTLFLLVAAAATVGAAALPAVMRGLAADPPMAARPGIGEVLRAHGYITVAGTDGGGDGPAGQEGAGADRAWDPLEGGHRSGAKGPPGDQLERRAREAMKQRGLLGSDRDAGALPPWGVTAGPVVLRAEPDESAAAVEQLREGETVIVVREQAGWLLVAQRRDQELTMGWLARGQLLLPRLRP